MPRHKHDTSSESESRSRSPKPSKKSTQSKKSEKSKKSSKSTRSKTSESKFRALLSGDQPQRVLVQDAPLTQPVPVSIPHPSPFQFSAEPPSAPLVYNPPPVPTYSPPLPSFVPEFPEPAKIATTVTPPRDTVEKAEYEKVKKQLEELQKERLQTVDKKLTVDFLDQPTNLRAETKKMLELPAMIPTTIQPSTQYYAGDTKGIVSPIQLQPYEAGKGGYCGFDTEYRCTPGNVCALENANSGICVGQDSEKLRGTTRLKPVGAPTEIASSNSAVLAEVDTKYRTGISPTVRATVPPELAPYIKDDALQPIGEAWVRDVKKQISDKKKVIDGFTCELLLDDVDFNIAPFNKLIDPTDIKCVLGNTDDFNDPTNDIAEKIKDFVKAAFKVPAFKKAMKDYEAKTVGQANRALLHVLLIHLTDYDVPKDEGRKDIKAFSPDLSTLTWKDFLDDLKKKPESKRYYITIYTILKQWSYDTAQPHRSDFRSKNEKNMDSANLVGPMREDTRIRQRFENLLDKVSKKRTEINDQILRNKAKFDREISRKHVRLEAARRDGDIKMIKQIEFEIQGETENQKVAHLKNLEELAWISEIMGDETLLKRDPNAYKKFLFDKFDAILLNNKFAVEVTKYRFTQFDHARYRDEVYTKMTEANKEYLQIIYELCEAASDERIKSITFDFTASKNLIAIAMSKSNESIVAYNKLLADCNGLIERIRELRDQDTRLLTEMEKDTLKKQRDLLEREYQIDTLCLGQVRPIIDMLSINVAGYMKLFDQNTNIRNTLDDIADLFGGIYQLPRNDVATLMCALVLLGIQKKDEPLEKLLMKRFNSDPYLINIFTENVIKIKEDDKATITGFGVISALCEIYNHPEKFNRAYPGIIRDQKFKVSEEEVGYWRDVLNSLNVNMNLDKYQDFLSVFKDESELDWLVLGYTKHFLELSIRMLIGKFVKKNSTDDQYNCTNKLKEWYLRLPSIGFLFKAATDRAFLAVPAYVYIQALTSKLAIDNDKTNYESNIKRNDLSAKTNVGSAAFYRFDDMSDLNGHNYNKIFEAIQNGAVNILSSDDEEQVKVDYAKPDDLANDKYTVQIKSSQRIAKFINNKFRDSELKSLYDFMGAQTGKFPDFVADHDFSRALKVLTIPFNINNMMLSRFCFNLKSDQTLDEICGTGSDFDDVPKTDCESVGDKRDVFFGVMNYDLVSELIFSKKNQSNNSFKLNLLGLIYVLHWIRVIGNNPEFNRSGKIDSLVKPEDFVRAFKLICESGTLGHVFSAASLKEDAFTEDKTKVGGVATSKWIASRYEKISSSEYPHIRCYDTVGFRDDANSYFLIEVLWDLFMNQEQNTKASSKLSNNYYAPPAPPVTGAAADPWSFEGKNDADKTALLNSVKSDKIKVPLENLKNIFLKRLLSDDNQYKHQWINRYATTKTIKKELASKIWKYVSEQYVEGIARNLENAIKAGTGATNVYIDQLALSNAISWNDVGGKHQVNADDGTSKMDVPAGKAEYKINIKPVTGNVEEVEIYGIDIGNRSNSYTQNEFWKSIGGNNLFITEAMLNLQSPYFQPGSYLGLITNTIKTWNDLQTEYTIIASPNANVYGAVSNIHFAEILLRCVGEPIKLQDNIKKYIDDKIENLNKTLPSTTKYKENLISVIRSELTTLMESKELLNIAIKKSQEISDKFKKLFSKIPYGFNDTALKKKFETNAIDSFTLQHETVAGVADIKRTIIDTVIADLIGIKTPEEARKYLPLLSIKPIEYLLDNYIRSPAVNKDYLVNKELVNDPINSSGLDSSAKNIYEMLVDYPKQSVINFILDNLGELTLAYFKTVIFDGKAAHKKFDSLIKNIPFVIYGLKLYGAEIEKTGAGNIDWKKGGAAVIKSGISHSAVIKVLEDIYNKIVPELKRTKLLNDATDLNATVNNKAQNIINSKAASIISVNSSDANHNTAIKNELAKVNNGTVDTLIENHDNYTDIIKTCDTAINLADQSDADKAKTNDLKILNDVRNEWISIKPYVELYNGIAEISPL